MFDEKKSIETLKREFPNQVIYVERSYYDEDVNNDYSKVSITSTSFNRQNDKYLQGLEYVSDVVLLSRCTSAILSYNNGSIAAFYMNGGKYENTYFFEMGKY
jgi:hypothetical protein